MMLVRNALLPVRQKHLGGLLLLTVIAVICVAFSMSGKDDLDVAKREILLRRIGHETLLQSGDSVSRVLPVKRIAKNEYRLSFERAFTFNPDSLVRTTRRLLANDPLGSDHVVNVLNCADYTVAYGYAISGTSKDDIISCLGRTQPSACYYIKIRFGSAETNREKIALLLGSLVLLAALGYMVLRPAKQRSSLPQNGSVKPVDLPGSPDVSPRLFTLGSMSFDAEARKLMMAETTIDLTNTEARVLSIFALSPNEVIERSRLQKEIWEDEGVIVGRSLDMFISKLRKKLEADPSIRLVVIRGKGYRLEISAEGSWGA